MAEFGIEKKKCYLCGNEGLVKFHEHYYFCPECACIYTYVMIIESNCDHLQENHFFRSRKIYPNPVKEPTPTVIRDSWYKATRDENRQKGKAYIIEKEDDSQICSICGANCIADGW
jgi:hypothetical protein